MRPAQAHSWELLGHAGSGTLTYRHMHVSCTLALSVSVECGEERGVTDRAAADPDESNGGRNPHGGRNHGGESVTTQLTGW